MKKKTFAIENTYRITLDYFSFLLLFSEIEKLNFFSTERNGLKFCMHERNMLWKAHDFLTYARQTLTNQNRFCPRDAGTGPGPLS